MTTEPPGATCGHEFERGGVAYACERIPHPVGGHGSRFRHAATVDGTDPASRITWAETASGDGQDWTVGWGTVAGYAPAERTTA